MTDTDARAPSVLKILGRTTTHLFRVYADIEVGLGEQVLDLVDPGFGILPSKMEEESLPVGEIKVMVSRSSSQVRKRGEHEQVTVLACDYRLHLHVFATLSRLSFVPPRAHSLCSHTMGVTSTNDATSIFKDGKLKSGIYKIQNIVSQTYVDIREHNKELCGRPATVLEGKGLVGSCPHSTPIVLSLPSVGNSSFWSWIYYTQGTVFHHVSLCTYFVLNEVT